MLWIFPWFSMNVIGAINVRQMLASKLENLHFKKIIWV
jgi:hypothetical protein